MPKVGSKEFPYTAEGFKAAKKEKVKKKLKKQSRQTSDGYLLRNQ